VKHPSATAIFGATILVCAAAAPPLAKLPPVVEAVRIRFFQLK
jgi:hypothetical protein